MDFFNKNLDALKNRYPEIVEFFEDREKDSNADILYDVRSESFGDDTALYIVNGNEVIQLTTLYSREELLDLWIKPFDFSQYLNGKVFFFGLGDGSFARKMMSLIPGNMTLIVEEPSADIMQVALHYSDMSDLFEDEKFFLLFHPVIKNTKISYLYRNYMTYTDINYMKFICYPNYDILFENEYKEHVEGLRLSASDVICNQNLYANCGEECNENTFKCVHYFEEGRSLFDLRERMPKGFPAIVIAGGPSLDKNVRMLKEAKGKAFIVCTDTALRPVIQAGIIPDIAVSSDAFKGDKYFSEEASLDVPLVCHLHVGYKAMDRHKGIKIFYNNTDLWIQDYMNREEILLMPLESGGSVSNDALSLAYLLGADRIILIGQDLAYTDDKTHSEKTVEGEMAEKDFRYMVWDTDIYGNPIKSSEQFLLYRDWIEATISKYEDLKVIDATEGGILIKGSEIMPLKDAIARECTEEYDFSSIIEGTEDFLDDEHKKSFADYMCSLTDKYEQTGKKIEEALTLYSEMRWRAKSGNYSPSKLRSMGEKSAALFEEINNSNEMEYVLNLIQGDINDTLKKMNRVEADERDEILTLCDYSINTLTMMRDAIERLRPQIEEMAETLKPYRE